MRSIARQGDDFARPEPLRELSAAPLERDAILIVTGPEELVRELRVPAAPADAAAAAEA